MCDGKLLHGVWNEYVFSLHKNDKYKYVCNVRSHDASGTDTVSTNNEYKRLFVLLHTRCLINNVMINTKCTIVNI